MTPENLSLFEDDAPATPEYVNLAKSPALRADPATKPVELRAKPLTPSIPRIGTPGDMQAALRWHGGHAFRAWALGILSSGKPSTLGDLHQALRNDRRHDQPSAEYSAEKLLVAAFRAEWIRPVGEDGDEIAESTALDLNLDSKSLKAFLR